MACSKYEYVKQYEEHRTALFQTYIVVRIDGRGFTKFCNAHNFGKPNDRSAIQLMNEAALYVCQKFKDIFLAYGQSDEYSFALVKDAELFNRRIDKIQTCIVSAFTSSYIHNWLKFFKEKPLVQLPSFDARIVQYPNLQVLKDYFRWRQVDCHINNLYNTTFWEMMKKGMKNTEVQNKLKDTNSGQKNQILFSQFGINYNKIQQIYRRGTIICYKSLEANEINPIGQNKRPKITKQLKNSIRQIKQVCLNTDKILNKLSDCELAEDQLTFKQLGLLRKQLEQIKNKYEEIDNKTKNLKTVKQKNNLKVQLKLCYDDLIKQQFWETIKID